ncbi:MAG: lipase family protein [Bacteroidota bacterium]|nr:lipase family protein [Bacteroidota bacterium]
MKYLVVSFFLLISFAVSGQTYLHPGFSGKEYLELLSIFSRHNDTLYHGDSTPPPVVYDRIYRSPEVGLKNQWSLWIRKDKKLAVINLRGTVAATPSWLENFYADMIPATGSLQLNDTTVFQYQLAADPKAMVHAGWAIGLAHLAPTIVQKIKETYAAAGIREFIIMGHSQGGALAFLTRSYLYYLTQKGGLPADITYKTYCSAAPKPGNLYYAYDFDFITRNGWAFTVVNAKDWVPETPFSVQQITDFNTINPFVNIKPVLRKQKWLVRWYLSGVYNKMSRRAGRSARTFEKYLGSSMYKQVKKYLPQLRQPQYEQGANYMRAGVPVVLEPDEFYLQRYPDTNPGRLFIHHGLYPYYYLVKKYYGNQ